MSEPDDNTVYIAVIGDSGVGKTSLITAAATETFPDIPPPVLPPAKLPADTTPEGVPVVITDTSSRPEDKQAFEAACRGASVVVLCFSMEKPNTLRRVSSYWMPELRRLGITVPILLVGCKSDVRPADQTLHQAVLPIVKTFPQIETCMECSSRKLQFVGEVFYYALKAVVHPMAPLYEPEAQQLRPLCARALKRIFTLCDIDQDGILSDAELNAFQEHCFNAPLQAEELAGVKQVVSEKLEQGIKNGGLTLPGFLFLHALFIERGRLETTWAVLRRYGYNNELRLHSDLLARADVPRAPDQVVELTSTGRAFFQNVFERFDVDDDGALSAREREEMFSTAPEDLWKVPQYAGTLVETSRKGLLTLPGYLAMWTYTAALDPKAAFAGALYLGLPSDAPLDRILTVSKPRRQERRVSDAPRRSVLQCLVFAGKGADATPVLEGLISQARSVHGTATMPISSAVASVQLPASPAGEEGGAGTAANAAANATGGSSSPPSANGTIPGSPGSLPPAVAHSATMILRSVSEEQAHVLLESPGRSDELQRCDAAVFVFDGSKPESLRSAVELMVAVASASGDQLPCMFMALNSNEMAPPLVDELEGACTVLSVASPMTFPQVLSTQSLHPLYRSIAQAALYPEGHIPETPSLRATKQHRKMLRKAALVTAGGTVAALTGYFAYRFYKQHMHDSGAARDA